MIECKRDKLQSLERLIKIILEAEITAEWKYDRAGTLFEAYRILLGQGEIQVTCPMCKAETEHAVYLT